MRLLLFADLGSPGGASYGNTRLLGRYANKFFTELPYRTIDNMDE